MRRIHDAEILTNMVHVVTIEDGEKKEVKLLFGLPQHKNEVSL